MPLLPYFFASCIFLQAGFVGEDVELILHKLLMVLQDQPVYPVVVGSVKGTKVTLLDITTISQPKDEDHISRYNIKATPEMQDCLNWCLPGVPDAWDELLFAQI
ncbi:hypothetical protein POM88_007216 [Heracleum sosnowskyi]|uniref:Trichome birefringence-like C-terminal domain-containing protein n=1 Tax=Heracleum sosnowskyi TaxID=360622 RepID=A0AAD8N7C4_9APIA|nr:hypothetical protein POM88_007216 [Heracleum sosnowskyi]